MALVWMALIALVPTAVMAATIFRPQPQKVAVRARR